jgi:membrane protease YdiL (CAAX protease family)
LRRPLLWLQWRGRRRHDRIVTTLRGWTVRSPEWGLLVTVAMWAPAAGRYLACRTVDRGFRSPLPLSRWGMTGARVILVPLAVPMAVYGTAYAIALSAGLAHWSPGGGHWTTGSQIAANVVANLTILGVFGTLTALGEEIGWRGYLQPRLDAAGVRHSVAVVWLCQLLYHARSWLARGRGRPFHESGSLRRCGPSTVVSLGIRVLPRAEPVAGGLLP